MVEELGEEFSPTDLAAAAFKLLLGEPRDEARRSAGCGEVEEREWEQHGARRERTDGSAAPRRDATRSAPSAA